jgi:hypothetical protein
MEDPELALDGMLRLQMLMQDYAGKSVTDESDEVQLKRLVDTAKMMQEWTDEQMAALHRLAYILLYERIRLSEGARDFCAHRLAESTRQQQMFAVALVGEGSQCRH